MKIKNKTKINTQLLRKELNAAARWFNIDTMGLKVKIEEAAPNIRRYGTCYYRQKGGGPIILYDHISRNLKDMIKTFVHELKHLDDYRGYRLNGKKIPRGREKRCNIWANKWEEEQGLQFQSLKPSADKQKKKAKIKKKVTPKDLSAEFSYSPITIRKKLRKMEEVEKTGTRWVWEEGSEELEKIKELLK